jgi:hypothetical protein
MPVVKNARQSAPRVVAARWTPALTKGGWTPVSDFFLDNYRKLDQPLTSNEALLVIHLMRHKWDDAAPFPAFKTLAKRMGVTATSARNHARSLEKKGYLKREKRVGTTNRFDLTPLFRALENLQAFEAGRRAGQDEAGGRPKVRRTGIQTEILE